MRTPNQCAKDFRALMASHRAAGTTGSDADRWLVEAFSAYRREVIEACAKYVNNSDRHKPLECIAMNLIEILGDFTP